MTQPDLAERRATLSAAIVDREREAGAALLDGEPFDPSGMVEAKNELSVISAAEAEAVRRERVAQAAAWDAQCAEARREAGKALATHGAALTRVEAAAKALADDLRIIQASRATMATQCNRMGIRPPVALDGNEMAVSVSRLIGGELMGVGGRSHFGYLKWPSVPTPDWPAYAASVAASLKPMVGDA